jgi:hypothetical protein
LPSWLAPRLALHNVFVSLDGPELDAGLTVEAVFHALAVEGAMSYRLLPPAGRDWGDFLQAVGRESMRTELSRAVVAALLLHLLFPGMGVVAGTPAPGKGVGPLDAAAIECILTFFLMTAVLMTAVDASAPRIAGLGVGLVVVFDVLAAGPLTGAAMNPARAFGPELVSGTWAAAWAYWVGPIAGALIASLVYRYFFQTPPATALQPPAPPAGGARAGRRGGRAGGKR